MMGSRMVADAFSYAERKAYTEAILNASSLESTVWAAPSVSTTRTPCGREGRGTQTNTESSLLAASQRPVIALRFVKLEQEEKKRKRKPSRITEFAALKGTLRTPCTNPSR